MDLVRKLGLHERRLKRLDVLQEQLVVLSHDYTKLTQQMRAEGLTKPQRSVHQARVLELGELIDQKKAQYKACCDLLTKEPTS